MRVHWSQLPSGIEKPSGIRILMGFYGGLMWFNGIQYDIASGND